MDQDDRTTGSFTAVMFLIFIVFLIYLIYRFFRNFTKGQSSDRIPEAKERMKLFNERKEALIQRARDIYLKKHAAKQE